MPRQRQQNHNGVYVALSELLELRSSGTRKPEASRRAVQSVLPGERKSIARGRGMEFIEVRPYQAGDDIRSIDWRVSARTGKPFTKLYSEERESSAYFAVDQRINMFFGSDTIFKSVFVARLTALFGWNSLAAGHRVGGLVVGETIQRIRSGTTRRSLLQLLQSVSDANCSLHARSQSSVSLKQVFDDCLLHTSTGATITVLSDFHDIDTQSLQSLVALARKRKLILLKIADPLEAVLPVVGSVGIGNGVDTARVVISKVQQQQFSERRAWHAQQLIDCVDKCSARLLEWSTSDDVALILRSYVEARHASR